MALDRKVMENRTSSWAWGVTVVMVPVKLVAAPGIV